MILLMIKINKLQVVIETLGLRDSIYGFSFNNNNYIEINCTIQLKKVKLARLITVGNN